MSSLDFGSLQDVLADWPKRPLPEQSLDGVFERIRKILLANRSSHSAMIGADLMSLLRHVLRRQSLQSGVTAHLRLPRSQGWPGRDHWAQFGVRAQDAGTDYYLIEALPWSPDWLSEPDTPLFEDAFAERNVRSDHRCRIDPFLEEAAGFEFFTSPGQREAVRSAFLVPAGETLIVELPTGSGKSFVAQAPILVRGVEGPATICIVPTTALALDQARQTSKMLKRRFPRKEVPLLAWHAGLSPEQRQAVKTAIRQGTQGILYCSPESFTGALLPALYDAAEAGLLGYLVVDEAHLLSQWGDGFRPAFQMLAGVRRGLLARAEGRPFRTVLMSATLTPETISTFDTLFGPSRNVQMTASMHLRPEPQYWIHQENDPAEKVNKVLEAIRQAPRPVILYVTKRDDAKSWLKRLRNAGFVRTACFHGNTPDDERGSIIDQWAENDLDIVVATSAFGVGIDKRDVRTVIHATVPETIDRFYQEVGRGGRDGKTSASLLIYADQDRDIANSLSAPALISNELGFARWDAMAASAKKLDALGLLLSLDLNVVPAHARQQNDYNVAWNMRTLILMARAGMIELESQSPEPLVREDGETDHAFEKRTQAYWSQYFEQTVVRIIETGSRNQGFFDARISHERSTAFHASQAGGRLLDELLSGTRDVADLLQELYTNREAERMILVSRACGGCPAGRRMRNDDIRYSAPPAFGIRRVETVDHSAFAATFPQISTSAPIILALPEGSGTTQALEALSVLVSNFGIREIALPNALRKLPGIATLHQKVLGRLVLVQSLEEERAAGFAEYQLARASIVDEETCTDDLMLLERPLHVIVTPRSVSDPFHPARKLVDTGSNLLTWDQLRAGYRA
jgi:superfamily II DNA/RNA helicase